MPGISGHVAWILNSINIKNLQRFSTQTVSKGGLHNSLTALSKVSWRLVCSIITRQTFKVRALAHELKSWALESNFDKSEANLFQLLKIIFCMNQKECCISENVNLRDALLNRALTESPFARLFHRMSLCNQNRSYHLFACCVKSLFALNLARFHGI